MLQCDFCNTDMVDLRNYAGDNVCQDCYDSHITEDEVNWEDLCEATPHYCRNCSIIAEESIEYIPNVCKKHGGFGGTIY